MAAAKLRPVLLFSGLLFAAAVFHPLQAGAEEFLPAGGDETNPSAESTAAERPASGGGMFSGLWARLFPRLNTGEQIPGPVEIYGGESVLLSGVSAGKSFLGPRSEGDADGFFKKKGPSPVVREPESREASAEESSDVPPSRNAWSIEAGLYVLVDLDTNWGYGPALDVRVTWSPIPHLGFSLDTGIHLISPYIWAGGPDSNNWEFWSYYISIADSSTDWGVYVMELGGGSHLLDLTPGIDFYLNGSGVRGLYGGAGLRLQLSTAPFQFHPGTGWPEIEHIGEQSGYTLPVLERVNLGIIPRIGYKLLLWRIPFGIEVGYVFSSSPISGLIIKLSSGYTF